MAGTFQLAEAYITFSTKGLSGVQQDLGRLKSAFTSSVGQLGTLAAAAVGVAAGAIAGFVGLFAEAEDASTRLRNALLLEGDAAGAMAGKLDAYAVALGKAANLSGTFVKALELQGLHLGITADQIGAVTKAAIGLAHLRGRSEQEVIGAFARAIGRPGEPVNEMQLRRLLGGGRGGGGKSGAKTGNELLAEAQQMGEKGFLLRQADEAKTYSGQVRTLGLELRAAGIALGRAFAPTVLPIIQTVTNAVKDLSAWLSSLTGEQARTIAKWVGAAAAAVALGTAIVGTIAAVSALGAAIAAIASPVGLVVVGVGAALAGLAAYFLDASIEGESFAAKLATVWNHPLEAIEMFWIRIKLVGLEIRTVFAEIGGSIEKLAVAIGGPIGYMIAHFDKLRSAIKQLAPSAAAGALGALPIVGPALQAKQALDAAGKIGLHGVGSAEKIPAVGPFAGEIARLQGELKDLRGKLNAPPGKAGAGAPGGKKLPGAPDVPGNEKIKQKGTRPGDVGQVYSTEAFLEHLWAAGAQSGEGADDDIPAQQLAENKTTNQKLDELIAAAKGPKVAVLGA